MLKVLLSTEGETSMMLFWTEKGTVHYEWRGLRPEAEHHAPALCPQSAGATAHARTQEGAVGTDPSMSDISYIDVKTRKTSPHMHAHSGSRRDPDSTHSTRKDTWQGQEHTSNVGDNIASEAPRTCAGHRRLELEYMVAAVRVGMEPRAANLNAALLTHQRALHVRACCARSLIVIKAAHHGIRMRPWRPMSVVVD